MKEAAQSGDDTARGETKKREERQRVVGAIGDVRALDAVPGRLRGSAATQQYCGDVGNEHEHGEWAEPQRMKHIVAAKVNEDDSRCVNLQLFFHMPHIL